MNIQVRVNREKIIQIKKYFLFFTKPYVTPKSFPNGLVNNHGLYNHNPFSCKTEP